MSALRRTFNSTAAHFGRLPVPTALKRSAILKSSHCPALKRAADISLFLHGPTGASGCQQLRAHLRWSPAARCSWCSGTRSRSSAAWGASRSTGWCAGTRGCAFPLWHSEREGGREAGEQNTYQETGRDSAYIYFCAHFLAIYYQSRVRLESFGL